MIQLDSMKKLGSIHYTLFTLFTIDFTLTVSELQVTVLVSTPLLIDSLSHVASAPFDYLEFVYD